jgi:hypothetical protein
MYASDCGFDASSWTCPDGCCIAVSSGGGSSGGGCGGSCQTDNDCPGCDGCSGGTCVDDDSYCSSNMTCQQSECCYDNGGCVVVYGGTCNGDSGECGGPYSCGGCVEEGGSCGWDCDCITGGCLCGACSDSDADIVCDFSPQQLLVDLSGAGFSLTSARDGVKFDFLGNGNARQMAWTAAGSNAGWLVLDRNGNGQIDNGAELFSNVSPQPDPAPRGKLGFRALAVYDLPANGGNGDGVIDQRDAVFSRLLVWVDRNHNGVADPGELLTMQQAGIQSISLRYKPSTRTDAHGNRLGLRSNVTRTAGQPAGPRYVYEVTLVTEDSPLQR